jgi:flagellar biosynthetic protein FlhB
MAEQTEQNRSEDATPFKLTRARERGMVARSSEPAFMAAMVVLAGFLAAAANDVAGGIAMWMRTTLVAGIAAAADSGPVVVGVPGGWWRLFPPLALFGGTLMAVVIVFELIQLRGFLFSTHPLKPDFSRLNPAKGLKRLFSVRLLKETLKSVAKLAVYGTATFLVVTHGIERFAEVAGDTGRLPALLLSTGLRLLLTYIAIATGFALLDQLLVRKDFAKQMRMSRREVTREARDREGDPRIKQKRKKLHNEFVRQSEGLDTLPGSNLVVVNPEHFAVALRYDAATMQAPTVSAKGRNRFALALRDRAGALDIPVIRNPPLARALFHHATAGHEIPPDHYGAVAQLYIDLARDPRQPKDPSR